MSKEVFTKQFLNAVGAGLPVRRRQPRYCTSGSSGQSGGILRSLGPVLTFTPAGRCSSHSAAHSAAPYPSARSERGRSA